MATPTITGIAPATIPANAGGVIVLTGVNYNTAAVTAVTVNGTPATFVVTNDTTLTVTVPNAEPGLATIAVTNPTGTVTNAVLLTVTAYVIAARNNTATLNGTFETSGTTIFTGGNPVLSAYQGSDSNLWSTSATASYPHYLRRVAKIKAVKLENTRRPAGALAVPTF